MVVLWLLTVPKILVVLKDIKKAVKGFSLDLNLQLSHPLAFKGQLVDSSGLHFTHGRTVLH